VWLSKALAACEAGDPWKRRRRDEPEHPAGDCCSERLRQAGRSPSFDSHRLHLCAAMAVTGSFHRLRQIAQKRVCFVSECLRGVTQLPQALDIRRIRTSDGIICATVGVV
jgi:hypothetical protein